MLENKQYQPLSINTFKVPIPNDSHKSKVFKRSFILSFSLNTKNSMQNSSWQ